MMKHCLVALCLVSMAFADVGLKLKNSRYAGLSYRFLSGIEIEADQSLFAEKIGFQYLRLNIGKCYSIDPITIGYSIYAGSLYNRDFYDIGTVVFSKYLLFPHFAITGTLNPHYDSGYESNMNYEFGLNAHLYKGWSFLSEISTIPEYRNAEQRLRLGFVFQEKALAVTPVISIPVENKIKSMRVLVSMEYFL